MKNTPSKLTRRDRTTLADSLNNRIDDHFNPLYRRMDRDRQRLWRISIDIENGDFAHARKVAERLPFHLWEMMPQRVKKLLDLNATQIFNLR